MKGSHTQSKGVVTHRLRTTVLNRTMKTTRKKSRHRENTPKANIAIDTDGAVTGALTVLS